MLLNLRSRIDFTIEPWYVDNLRNRSYNLVTCKENELCLFGYDYLFMFQVDKQFKIQKFVDLSKTCKMPVSNDFVGFRLHGTPPGLYIYQSCVVDEKYAFFFLTVLSSNESLILSFKLKISEKKNVNRILWSRNKGKDHFMF